MADHQLVRRSLIFSVLSVLVTMISVAVLFDSPASANPVIIDPPRYESKSLSNFLRDLSDPSRGGQWGRVMVYDYPAGGAYPRVSGEIGDKVPTLASRLKEPGLFGATVPDSVRNYLERHLGISSRLHGYSIDERGLLVISGILNRSDTNELSMLGVRYMVATQPLGGWVQPQPYTPPTPPDNQDPNNRWPSLHGNEEQNPPQTTYRAPLGDYQGWDYLQTVNGYYIYVNRSAWRRAEFVQTGSYITRNWNEEGYELNIPSYMLQSNSSGSNIYRGPDYEYRDVRVTRDEPGNIVINAYGGRYQDGIVVLNEPIIDGWRATVDGKEIKVRAVNSVLMGVQVPSGRHTIEFHRGSAHKTAMSGSDSSTLYFFAGFLVALLIGGLIYFASARRAMFGPTITQDPPRPHE